MLLLNQMGSKLAIRLRNGSKTCYALSGKWVQKTNRGQTIYARKMLGSGSEFGGISLWRAGS